LRTAGFIARRAAHRISCASDLKIACGPFLQKEILRQPQAAKGLEFDRGAAVQRYWSLQIQ
jgi:hypothetical protein